MIFYHFSEDVEEWVKIIKRLYEQVRDKIFKQFANYMKSTNKHQKHIECQEVDLVVHLRKE